MLKKKKKNVIHFLFLLLIYLPYLFNTAIYYEQNKIYEVIIYVQIYKRNVPNGRK